MRKSNHHLIRTLLHKYPDGLTLPNIASVLNVDTSAVLRALKAMPDVYIDRWTQSSNKYAAVWCAVITPKNCPHPTKEDVDELQEAAP